jgi:hypothetical protein
VTTIYIAVDPTLLQWVAEAPGRWTSAIASDGTVVKLTSKVDEPDEDQGVLG